MRGSKRFIYLAITGINAVSLNLVQANPPSYADLAAGYTYTTSIGKVFTQVQGPSGPAGSFGVAWMDPSGTIWSSDQGAYKNLAVKPDVQTPNQNTTIVDSPATEACAKIGGTLPSAADFGSLGLYFDGNGGQDDDEGPGRILTAQGLKDFNTIFPDNVGKAFWTSTAFGALKIGYTDPYAVRFQDGGVWWSQTYGGGRMIEWNVRCLAK